MIERVLSFLGFHVDRPGPWVCDCDDCLCPRCDLTDDLCPCPKCDLCEEVLYDHTRDVLWGDRCRTCSTQLDPEDCHP